MLRVHQEIKNFFFYSIPLLYVMMMGNTYFGVGGRPFTKVYLQQSNKHVLKHILRIHMGMIFGAQPFPHAVYSTSIPSSWNPPNPCLPLTPSSTNKTVQISSEAYSNVVMIYVLLISTLPLLLSFGTCINRLNSRFLINLKNDAVLQNT